MENKNIVFNCTLEQYNKKYRNRRYRLLKYTKKQVEDFDKQYGHYVFNNKTYTLEFNKYLLKDRKWALIGDTYYEIPRPVRYTWFRNLNAGVQACCCLLGAGVIAGAVTLPCVLLNQNNPSKSNVKVSLSKTKGLIRVDKLDTPLKLNAFVSGSDKKPVWTSSDTSIATVEDGVVTGKKAGKVIITAEVEGIKASCEVNIESVYEIDWQNNNEEYGESLYSKAINSKHICFERSTEVGSNKCGETEDDLIYTTYDSSSKTLKIWANRAIAFDDDDRGSYYSNLFTECNKLEDIILNNIDVSQLTQFNEMFTNCKKLKSIDLSCFDTSNSTTFGAMFKACNNLQSIDLKTLDFSKATDLSTMFFECNSLKTLDISYINTKSLSGCSYMFRGCSELETILVSKDVNFQNCSSSDDMFYSCSKLVGGAGTKFDESKPIDNTRAIIDEGPSKPGYFTEKK